MASSPYSKTPVNDFYLDIMVKQELPKKESDKFYVVEKKYEFRPDKLAHDLYKDSSYWYVFALRNMDVLEDPIFDFKEGLEIRLPSIESIRRL